MSTTDITRAAIAVFVIVLIFVTMWIFRNGFADGFEWILCTLGADTMCSG